MKKKILVWETLGIVSGGQKMTLAVMDMLSDEYDFHCLIPTEGALSEELKKRNIPYTLLGDQTMPTGIKGKSVIFRYAALTLKAVFAGFKAVGREKADMIYAPGPAALPWSAVVGLLRIKPVVWHLHHVFLDRMTLKLLNICSGLRSVKRIIAVSECVGAQIENQKGKSKVNRIYNPVDFKRFSSGKSGVLKQELGINTDDTLLLGQIALLQQSKRQDMLLKTAYELKNNGVKLAVVLAGRARDEDAEYVKELHDTVKNLGLEEQTYFLGQRSDVPDILADLDLIMIPSSFEGFPLAGLEAASAGVPVVACDLAGAEEFVRVSNAGTCFKYDDVESAVDAVNNVIAHDNKSEYARNGKVFAESCSFDNYHHEVAKVFRL